MPFSAGCALTTELMLKNLITSFLSSLSASPELWPAYCRYDSMPSEKRKELLEYLEVTLPASSLPERAVEFLLGARYAYLNRGFRLLMQPVLSLG